ncbi:hypothetical protein F5Y18DRAFT_405468 [Xylariaceae sp. FL1019]|nr:hypothetical protein F5Y18DRAFT_405468 [Xylariaceae sp. FL1019]
MNIASWLQGIEPTVSDDDIPRRPRIRKCKRQPRSQMPTPTASTRAPPSKRLRPDDEAGEVDNDDPDRTPKERRGWSHSQSTSSRSSGSISPTSRMATLEIGKSPLVVAQIDQSDSRMPAELADMLNALDGFQSRVGIVPEYLSREVKARAEHDRNFFNFYPHTFQTPASNAAADSTAPADAPPRLSLDHVLDILSAAKECFNQQHPEANWNILVHWPVFQLALGTLTSNTRPTEGSKTLDTSPIRVRAMPCTTARLIQRPHGAKMIDFCLFVEPHGQDAEIIRELREGLLFMNHTDYHPLRHRPLVLSAESMQPDMGFRDAQIQLGVWQAEQWAFIERMLSSKGSTSKLIPLLPALIIQGHEWSFAATTRSGNQTVRSPLSVYQNWYRLTFYRYYGLSSLLVVPILPSASFMSFTRCGTSLNGFEEHTGHGIRMPSLVMKCRLGRRIKYLLVPGDPQYLRCPVSSEISSLLSDCLQLS